MSSIVLFPTGTGIVDLLGVKYFDSLFHVKRQTSKSLAIAIDYTSSMSDDIEAVKKTVIKLLTATVGSDNEPADYVLSMFYDPVKLKSVICLYYIEFPQRISSFHLK